MFKSRANKIWLIILLSSISTPLFAGVDLYDILEKEVWNIDPISKIVEWKPMIKDLFNKNLELIKNNEVKTMNNTINNIANYFKEKNCFVTKEDVFNIILNSNYEAKYNLESSLKQKWQINTVSDVTKSYKKFLSCQDTKSKENNYKDIKSIESQINNLYNKIKINEYEIETINQDNFWEDLFRNWDLEDSSFDVLQDIYNIWNVLMQNFDKNPKIYFYNIPDKTIESDFSINNIIWKKIASTNNNNTEIQTYSSNIDINKFILKTNQNNINIEDTNQCIDDTTIQNRNSTINQDNKTIDIEKYQEFISEVDRFISNANTDKNINNMLTEKFKVSTDKNSFSTTWSSNYVTETEKFINKKLTIDTCSTNCWNKNSIWEKEKCELDCSLSCFQKCNKISDTNQKIICKAECVCFLISWPEKPLANNLIEENIFKVRFCKIPTINQKIQRNKTVLSIEDIFHEMLNVLKTLSAGWEMIKNKQTKEFLEIPVEINFWKIFSFWLNVNRKKIPNTKATKAMESEREKEDKQLKASITNTKSNNNEKDNYNKYIVIQQSALENTNTQDISSINQYISKYDEENTLLNSTNNNYKKIMVKLQNKKNISITTQIETFLSQNIQFREEFLKLMSDSNDIAYSLSEKIKKSK